MAIVAKQHFSEAGVRTRINFATLRLLGRREQFFVLVLKVMFV